MRPILFVVPMLPQKWLMPLAILTVVAAVAITALAAANTRKNDNAEIPLIPIGIAAGIVLLLWLWTKNTLTLHSYGLMLVIGFFAATWVAAKEAKRRGQDPNMILDMALPMLVVTVLACRVLYVVLSYGQFPSFWDIFKIWDGGLSFYGAFIGAPLVFLYFAWQRKISVLFLMDIVTPSVFLGYAFGRVGCFLNGCCYGHECALPWAMRFHPDGNLNALTGFVHPTQLYSVFIALGLFFVMQRARISKPFTKFYGQLSLLFIALYLLERSFIEIFRLGATAEPMFAKIPWLTQAQFASILMMIGVGIAWFMLSHYSKQPEDKATQAIAASE